MKGLDFYILNYLCIYIIFTRQVKRCLSLVFELEASFPCSQAVSVPVHGAWQHFLFTAHETFSFGQFNYFKHQSPRPSYLTPTILALHIVWFLFAAFGSHSMARLHINGHWSIRDSRISCLQVHYQWWKWLNILESIFCGGFLLSLQPSEPARWLQPIQIIAIGCGFCDHL